MSEPASENFVTVSEAAQALGLSERQARRRAAALEASGRTRTDGRTRLVTVADMMSVRPDADRPRPAISSEDASPSTKSQKQTTGRTRRHDRTDISEPADGRTDGHEKRPDGHDDRKWQGEDDLVKQLRAEVDSLRGALQREQENTAAAQRLVDQSQQLQLLVERRAAALESEVEKLKALPAVEQGKGVGLGDGPQAQDSGLSGGMTPPGQAETPKRSIMGFLRRWW